MGLRRASASSSVLFILEGMDVEKKGQGKVLRDTQFTFSTPDKTTRLQPNSCTYLLKYSRERSLREVGAERSQDQKTKIPISNPKQHLI